MGSNFSLENFMDGQCHDFSEKGRSHDLICHNDNDSEFDADFDDVYEVQPGGILGSGKFSKVQMCVRREQPENKYAMKLIDLSIAGAASMSQIREEIEIMQLLGRHPNLISMIDADHSMPGHIRLVLDLCVGGDLFDRIQQKGNFTEKDSRLCIRKLIEGCAYVHSKGVMHRDMKPENVLLVSKDNDTDVKISDFGLAKRSRDSSKFPRSTTICGSDFYLAPELIMQEEYGREIDVWAVGVITYIVLSGSLPFYNAVLHKLYRQIVERDLSFAEQPWKQVSKAAQDFILRVLQIRPGDRLTAADALSHPWLYDARSARPSLPTTSRDTPSTWSHSLQQPSSAQIAAPRTLQHANKVQPSPGSQRRK